MPIRPEYRCFYGKEWKLSIRPRILQRAGGKLDSEGRYIGGARCEQCGKPDGKRVRVLHMMGNQYWAKRAYVRNWIRCQDGFCARFPKPQLGRSVRVVLGVAHLNHKPSDNRDSNLRALCGYCHLMFDKAHHRETRSRRKDLGRPLLGAAS